MRGFGNWLWVGGIAAAALGFFLAQPWLTVLGIAVAGTSLIRAAVRMGRPTDSLIGENLGEEAMWILRPLTKKTADIAALATGSSDPTVRVIASEALQEAKSIVEKAVALVKGRQQLRVSTKGRGQAETDIGRLQRQLAQARTPDETAALQSALEAKRRQLATLDEAQGRIKEIEARIAEADAALGELHARLSTSIVPGDVTEAQGEMGSLLGRLKSLGASLDEVGATLELKQE